MLERMIYVKPIRGSQLTPNNVQEECIRVRKVYDWVFDATTTDTEITLSPECADFVADAVAAGRTIVDVVCSLPPVPGFFPLDPPEDPDGFFSCTVSSRIERGLNGLDPNLAIVKVVFTIRPLVTIIDSAGNECEFRPTISVARRVVVCAPEPFTNDNVFCRIIALECDTNFIETGVPDLGLQIALDICFEIQVEADVKLEVLAKFCFPRPNDIEIPTGGTCPPFEWPQQCDVFPRMNCDCQAFVDTDALAGTVLLDFTGIPDFVDLAIGDFTTELNAEICDNCTLAGSTIEWIVEDTRILPTGVEDEGFTFTATDIEMPTCAVEDIAGLTGVLVMRVGGEGVVRFEDPDQPNRRVTFELVLLENPVAGVDDAYVITLFDLAGGALISLGDALLPVVGGLQLVPDEDLIIQDCRTFGDIPFSSL